MERNFQRAREALDNTRFPDTLSEREACDYYERTTKAAEQNVKAAARDDLDQLKGHVDEVDDRYTTEVIEPSRKLRKDMASGRGSAAEFGERLDALRAHAEHLDSLPTGLKAREDRIAEAMEDPLGYLDRMFERAPSLRKPDWPW